jgi:tight adherence protein B
MSAPDAFPVGFLGAGLVAALAVSLRQRERVWARLSIRAPRAPRWSIDWSGGRLAARAARRGWTRHPGGYAAALGGAGLLGAAVGLRLAGAVGGAAGLLGGPLLVEGWLGRRLTVAAASLDEDFRDWVRSLAAASRAGLSLRRALAEAAGDSGPWLRPHLRRMTARLESGASLEEVVEGLAIEVGSRDAELVAAVLAVHRRAGGDLATLLDDVAATVALRLEGRRDLRALTSQGRASGAVLAVLPVAFVGLLSGIGGNGLGAFYRTATGSALLALGLVLQGLGFVWIRRIVGGSR